MNSAQLHKVYVLGMFWFIFLGSDVLLRFFRRAFLCPRSLPALAWR